MSKLLSLIVAATFAVVAAPSFAASHTGAAMDKKGDAKMEKKEAKKKAPKKKAEKKAEDKK